MNTDEKTSNDARLSRLEQASEWLLRMENPSRTEEDVNGWLRWCDEDSENLVAFEAFQTDWRDLDALKVSGHADGSALTALLAQDADLRPRTSMRRRRLAIPWPGRRAWQWSPWLSFCFRKNAAHRPRANKSRPRRPIARLRSRTDPGSCSAPRTSINVDFNGSKRNLELSAGEAYFKVKHDRQHPFIVHAGNISVTAVGTAFDVRREPDGVTVTVEEGTVEIAGDVFAKKGLPTTWRAEAGYQLTYSSQGRTAMITNVDTSSALKWRGGELAYVWEPLGAVIEDLNRYSEHKVIIKDPAIAELRFTGTVFTASLADWVKAVEQVYPVRADNSANGDIVLVERR